MPVGLGDVEILVRQIVAAREPDFAVDHRNLPVVAVVDEEIQSHIHRVEDPALDPHRLHLIDEAVSDVAHASDIVVEEADFDALFHLCREHLKDPSEGDRVLDRVVFHENELLRLPEFMKLRLKPLRAVIVEDDVRVMIERVAGEVADVAGFICKALIRIGQAMMMTIQGIFIAAVLF